MPSTRRRRRSGPPVAGIAAGAIVLLLVGAGFWYWYQRDSGDEIVPEPPAAPVAEEGGPPFDERDVPPLDLPELDASDEFVRSLVAEISEHPQLSRWLVTDRLIDRFVGVVLDLAGNRNPAASVPFMRPEEPFRTIEMDGRTVVDPDSYRRWDLLSATFASVDTEGTVTLYLQLRPLIEEAYDELGVEEYTFDEALQLAIENLLEAEIRERPPEVELVEGIWEYSEPQLESARGAQKALLRMGPANTRRIQEKVRELARALGMEVDPDSAQGSEQSR